MKRKFTVGIASLAILLLAACSTSKLAQQNNNDDDVYYTAARAKEQPDYTAAEKNYRTENQLYGGQSYSDDYYYDDYAGRINRFYYNAPVTLYDLNPYAYDPFYYDYPGLYRPGLSFSIGIGSGWYDSYYNGLYGYGYPYYASRYWGPYSYYNAYPGYYGYGGGYYPYVSRAYSNPNYRTRPNRETTLGRGQSIYNPGLSRGAVQGTYNSGRPERYNPSASGATSRAYPSRGSETSTRPARRNTSEGYSPRESSPPRQQSRPVEYSRPERSSSPSYNGGSSRSSGSTGGGGSRPSRGGR